MSIEPTGSVRQESRGLTLSILGGLFMAALGIAFAILTRSQAVLLDGIFSLVGTGVAIVAMRVAVMVRRPDDEQFHFGYAAFEPMFNLVKGLLIAIVTVFALVAAVLAIIEGGRLVRGGLAVVYAVIAATGCLLISLAQRRLAKRTSSPLLEVDAKNWFVDGLISAGVAVAFLVATLLRGSGQEWFLPYVDPTVVILLSLASAPIPFLIVRANWNQLMGRAPDGGIQREARIRVDQALEGLQDITPHLRLLETGRTYYLQLYLVIGPESEATRIEELDRIRERVHRSVTRDAADVGLDVIFTRDPRWAGCTTPSGSAREIGDRATQ